MTTMAGLREKILTDLNRTDATAVAETAIADAKIAYDHERWWFNERRAKFGTTPDTEYLPLPSDYIECDSMLITFNGYIYPLEGWGKREHDRLANYATDTGVPTAFSIYDSQIRLYPIPDATYSVTMSYQFVMPALTVSESNVWTNELGNLMRFHAVADLYANYLHAPDRAAVAKQQEQEEYSRLQRRNAKYINQSPMKGYI